MLYFTVWKWSSTYVWVSLCQGVGVATTGWPKKRCCHSVTELIVISSQRCSYPATPLPCGFLALLLQATPCSSHCYTDTLYLVPFSFCNLLSLSGLTMMIGDLLSPACCSPSPFLKSEYSLHHRLWGCILVSQRILLGLLLTWMRHLNMPPGEWWTGLVGFSLHRVYFNWLQEALSLL